MARYRRKMSRRRSKRSFRKGLRVKRRNFPRLSSRGGIRL